MWRETSLTVSWQARGKPRTTNRNCNVILPREGRGRVQQWNCRCGVQAPSSALVSSSGKVHFLFQPKEITRHYFSNRNWVLKKLNGDQCEQLKEISKTLHSTFLRTCQLLSTLSANTAQSIDSFTPKRSRNDTLRCKGQESFCWCWLFRLFQASFTSFSFCLTEAASEEDFTLLEWKQSAHGPAGSLWNLRFVKSNRFASNYLLLWLIRKGNGTLKWSPTRIYSPRIFLSQSLEMEWQKCWTLLPSLPQLTVNLRKI